jgi:hypothetical protein
MLPGPTQARDPRSRSDVDLFIYVDAALGAPTPVEPLISTHPGLIPKPA